MMASRTVLVIGRAHGKSTNKTHRKWTAQAKLKLVLESLASDAKVAEICRREGLSPNQLYKWRKVLGASADRIFTPPGRPESQDPQITRLAGENTRMKNV